mmetsp:Transcript_54814/g.133121  ORF Transcript_54814/g.133121 Transcript_54814/m.133121 type:complete len:342 (-) Transcript_54814:2460-3485(-)
MSFLLKVVYFTIIYSVYVLRGNGVVMKNKRMTWGTRYLGDSLRKGFAPKSSTKTVLLLLVLLISCAHAIPLTPEEEEGKIFRKIIQKFAESYAGAPPGSGDRDEIAQQAYGAVIKAGCFLELALENLLLPKIKAALRDRGNWLKRNASKPQPESKSQPESESQLAQTSFKPRYVWVQHTTHACSKAILKEPIDGKLPEDKVLIKWERGDEDYVDVSKVQFELVEGPCCSRHLPQSYEEPLCESESESEVEEEESNSESYKEDESNWMDESNEYEPPSKKTRVEDGNDDEGDIGLGYALVFEELWEGEKVKRWNESMAKKKIQEILCPLCLGWSTIAEMLQG